MAEIPQIQILDKKHYFNQALVSLPDALPLPSLAGSSLRIRTVTLPISLNTLTNATCSGILDSWGVHPLPESTPAPYNDPSLYGRINCWGYGKVVESSFPEAKKGSWVYGYLPIGTLPFDIQVEAGVVPNQVLVTNSSRQQLFAMYNRYIIHPEQPLGDEIAEKSDSVALDCAFRVMHETAYLLNKYAFASSPEDRIPLAPALASWSAEDANLSGATVISFAPGSKVGLAFAYLARNERTGAYPERLIAAASPSSKAFVEGTSLYDSTVLSSDDPMSLLSSLDVTRDSNIFVLDFGGRANAALNWVTVLKPTFPNLKYIQIGIEVLEVSHEQFMAGSEVSQNLGGVLLEFAFIRGEAMERIGEREYFEGLTKSWEALRQRGIWGLEIKWGEGMEAVIKGYESFCQGTAQPNAGLVFKI
ncbi:hypothetical protein F5Y19DRAFT_486382 [Xylariaceae sp. FL1651]|nr:hypothetical protein F5Y19DRAFT_486382 [Xylariaceae sp. FL1651]